MPEHRVPRKFVQIHCTGPGHYVAVADDGTAWEFRRRDYAWLRLPDLPHRKTNHEQ